jgi:hypothetical protein
MLDVAVTEIGLQGARVVALVGQCIAASVPEHVRMRLEPQLGLGACTLDHASEASGAEGCSPLRREHERRSWFLLALKASQRTQFITEDRMDARRALLDPADVQGTRPEVHLIPTKVHKFEGAQAVPIGHEDHGRVAVVMAVSLGLCRQLLDFGFRQVLPSAQLLVWKPPRRNCSFYGRWRDQLPVRLGHVFHACRLNDCLYNRPFTNSRTQRPQRSDCE